MDNLGGPSPRFDEGGNADMLVEETNHYPDKIYEHDFFVMEVQVERVWKHLVG